MASKDWANLDCAHSNEKIRQPIVDKWTGRLCKLNGRMAKISGRNLRFAKIRSLQGSVEAEYAWETVDAIMNKSQNFSSQ